MAQPAMTSNTPFANNYAREVPLIDHGRGVWLWDANGTRYLDFGSGIAVNALGYGDRRLAKAVEKQMRRLVHVSNLYATAPGIELGRRLLDLSQAVGRRPFTAVHFGNSGAEANEGAIKYARLFAHETRGPGHHRILSLTNGFHGRTMGALSATPKQAYRTKFEPLVPGFDVIPFNDPEEVLRAIDETVAAVIVEVVQGEGGLELLSEDMVAALNHRTAETGTLLVADEIQTGLGRLGELFGSTTVGLTPDIICLSKPLAGGLPMSATLIPAAVNDLLTPGDHGTTFGGGPTTATAAMYVLDRLTEPEFLPRVRQTAEVLDQELQGMADEFPCIVNLRGRGLLRGLQIDLGPDQDRLFPEILSAARDQGLLILRSGSDVVRIAPPLIIRESEIRRGIDLLRSTMNTINSRRNV